MKAIILAGGLGTRLRSVVSDVPKPMAPISGKPFLAYQIDYLMSFGLDELVLSICYLPEKVKEYFGDNYRGVKIKYALEDRPLGTGGAIVNSLNTLQSDEPVLVMNGDSLVMFDYGAMYKNHLKGVSPLTIALRHIDDCYRYGKVDTEGDVITAFNHKGEAGPGYINAGVYVINPSLFDGYNMPEEFSFEGDFCTPYIPEIHPPFVKADSYFIDIGIPEDYARAQDELPQKLSGIAA